METLPPSTREHLMTSPGRWIREGIVTGLIAFVAVAVFYFAFDVLSARGALFTVSAACVPVWRPLMTTRFRREPALAPAAKMVAMVPEPSTARLAVATTAAEVRGEPINNAELAI